MKLQIVIFFFFLAINSSSAQNTEKNINQIIEQLPRIEIKSVKSDLEEYETEEARRGSCRPHNFFKARLNTIGDCEEFGYCRGIKLYFSGTEASVYSSCENNYSITIPKNANKEIKKRYIALTERYRSRYPNNKTQKTPELQSTLQEIRF